MRELPEECRAVASFENGQLNLETNEQRHVDAVRPDLVSELWLERLARALAPIRDVSTEDLASTLPAASRLLDVLGLHVPDAGALVRRWQGKGRTTKAVIGESTDGPFQIDIRADGPHGLVAGTTGSGKSELLQTMIASLAVGNRPDEFNFVLVDYKGGAAFKDCNHLPHTVGMVTDLDGHLTTRALESLGAELRRREHQLADADAKDIEDYLAGRQPGDEPMPPPADRHRRVRGAGRRAARLRDRPGRRRPARSLARRAPDPGDAAPRRRGQRRDQVEHQPAHRPARHRRRRLRRRHRVLGRRADPEGVPGPRLRPPRPLLADPVPVLPRRWPPGRRGRGQRADLATSTGTTCRCSAVPTAPLDDDEDDVSIPTDLATLVGAINGANDELGLPQMRKPWLPPLPEMLGVASLARPGGTTAAVPPLPLGLADLPRQQQQVASRGTSWAAAPGRRRAVRSGRSNACACSPAAIARLCSPDDVHLYGIDAGNNALLPLMALPHVGAVVTRTQTDRMYRLVAFLQKELADVSSRWPSAVSPTSASSAPGVPPASGCPTSSSSWTAGRASSRPSSPSTAACSSTASPRSSRRVPASASAS